MSAKPRPVEVEDEDLDDLDDIIAQFTPTTNKKPDSTAAPSATTTSSTKPTTSIPTAPSDNADLLDDDFAKELAQGMESLMRELTSDHAGAGGATGEDGEELNEEQRAAFKAAWEKMLMDELDQGVNPITGQLPGGSGKEKTKEKEKEKEGGKGKAASGYQSSLKQAMDSIHESEELFKGMNLGDDSDEGLFKQLLEMSKGDLGSEDSEELQDMLMGMLSTILSKEVLYEPIVELRDKFPDYLAKNSSSLSKSDLDRYKGQLECVKELGTIFEDPKYSDTDEEMKARVSTWVEKLQGYGSPPDELTGPIPPGLPGGMDMPEGCTIS